MIKRLGLFCLLLAACSLRYVEAKENPFTQKIEALPESVVQQAEVRVLVTLPPEHEFTEGVALEFRAQLRSMRGLQVLKKAKLKQPQKQLPIRFRLPEIRQSEAVLEIHLNVPYCSAKPPKMCKYKSVDLTQPLSMKADGKAKIELVAEIK